MTTFICSCGEVVQNETNTCKNPMCGVIPTQTEAQTLAAAKQVYNEGAEAAILRLELITEDIPDMDHDAISGWVEEMRKVKRGD